MKFKSRLKIEAGKLEVTPLIDVVFLLLIFFMLSSSFIFQPGIKVKLPESQVSETKKEKAPLARGMAGMPQLGRNQLKTTITKQETTQEEQSHYHDS